MRVTISTAGSVRLLKADLSIDLSREGWLATERPRFSAGPLQRLLASFLSRDEFGNRNAAMLTHAAPVKLDPRNFMKGFGREIACTAMRATDHGYRFNNE